MRELKCQFPSALLKVMPYFVGLNSRKGAERSGTVINRYDFCKSNQRPSLALCEILEVLQQEQSKGSREMWYVDMGDRERCGPAWDTAG